MRTGLGIVLAVAMALGCGRGTDEDNGAVGDAGIVDVTGGAAGDVRGEDGEAPVGEDANVGFACGQLTDAGYRICCGSSTEIPGFSCVDLTQDGGEYGIYGRCIENGEMFDAKIAGARCCEGLVRTEPDVETTESYEDFGYPKGCGPSAPPSAKICLPCGNGECDPIENRCNCPADCE